MSLVIIDSCCCYCFCYRYCLFVLLSLPLSFFCCRCCYAILPVVVANVAVFVFYVVVVFDHVVTVVVVEYVSAPLHSYHLAPTKNVFKDKYKPDFCAIFVLSSESALDGLFDVVRFLKKKEKENE